MGGAFARAPREGGQRGGEGTRRVAQGEADAAGAEVDGEDAVGRWGHP